MIIHLIWIFAIIAMIFFIIHEYREWHDFELRTTIFVGMFTALMTLLFVLILIGVIDLTADKEIIKISEYEIYSLKDASSIKGKKYLMSGYIDEKMVYRAFVNKEEGKAIKEFSSDKSIIYEDGGSKVEVYSSKFTSPFISKLLGSEIAEDEIKYNIHIPEGSITTEYELDLE